MGDQTVPSPQGSALLPQQHLFILVSLCPFALSQTSSNLPVGPQCAVQGLAQMQKRQVRAGYKI